MRRHRRKGSRSVRRRGEGRYVDPNMNGQVLETISGTVHPFRTVGVRTTKKHPGRTTPTKQSTARQKKNLLPAIRTTTVLITLHRRSR
jgi:hypothetical protein